MMSNSQLVETPWDTETFGLYTAEITEYTKATLDATLKQSGIYTLKLDPLADKSLAHEYGFYYCDTLLTPECTKGNLIKHSHSDISIKDASTHDLATLIEISHGIFKHARFHKDFKLPEKMAAKRYIKWLDQLFSTGQVYSLYKSSQLAGFIATQGSQLTLHAVNPEFQGKGLAKYWWSLVCEDLFIKGSNTISSSVSASNLAVVNLYVSLGFRFTQAVDVYHKHTD